jgi:hypothetical protein
MDERIAIDVVSDLICLKTSCFPTNFGYIHDEEYNMDQFSCQLIPHGSQFSPLITIER